jgi:hypothetical protein
MLIRKKSIVNPRINIELKVIKSRRVMKTRDEKEWINGDNNNNKYDV